MEFSHYLLRVLWNKNFWWIPSHPPPSQYVCPDFYWINLSKLICIFEWKFPVLSQPWKPAGQGMQRGNERSMTTQFLWSGIGMLHGLLYCIDYAMICWQWPGTKKETSKFLDRRWRKKITPFLPLLTTASRWWKTSWTAATSSSCWYVVLQLPLMLLIVGFCLSTVRLKNEIFIFPHSD